MADGEATSIGDRRDAPEVAAQSPGRSRRFGRTGPSRRVRAARRAGVALGVLVIAGGLGVWLARVPIATGYIDDALAARGVAARYELSDLGFGRQRLTNVVIGDPAAPDLVADWIETSTDLRVSGPHLTGVRAGHVRVRARLIDGRVSLGAIDRLLPAPSGKPFALPALDVDVADARVRLETAQGIVGLRIAGAGRLDDGFAGTVAAVAPRLAAGGCTLDGANALVKVRIARAAPIVSGPVRAAAARCGDVRVDAPRLALDARFSPALDRWRGRADVRSAAIRGGGVGGAGVSGTLTFAGSRGATAGALALTGTDVARAGLRADRIAIEGRYRVADAAAFAGRIGARGARASAAMVRLLRGAGAAAAGSPVAPLARDLGEAAARAADRFDLDAAVDWGAAGLVVADARIASASGAQVRLGQGRPGQGRPGQGRGFRWGSAGATIDGTLAVRGGGLPDIVARVAQARAGAPITGTARFAPIAADGVRLVLTPVTFSATPGGATRIATVATLSGPLGDGRVEALRVPIEAGWDGKTRLVVNPRCTPVSFATLAVGGLTLDPARLVLCPTGAALIETAGGRIAGGVRLAGTRLSGRLGSTPVTLAATGARMALGTRGFTVDGLRTRLGREGSATLLDFGQVSGRVAAGGIAGAFVGGSGRIGAVPLQLSAAAGTWQLVNGVVRVGGVMTVSDTHADAPRFKPMAARGVALTLANGTIDAGGALFEPVTQRKVADVRIAHRLGAGTGEAALGVPGITFDETLQPDALTPLTFGVIADVKGIVSGTGLIAWGPRGVTSTGTFGTTNIDLAAAFGPVTGIAGQIRFADLLALESAPGQVVTVKTINPGIPVEDGRITFQTFRDSRVLVNRGVWPFAGGTLTLEPTLLDFSAPAVRRMTFQVDGMDAGRFLQQFDFGNLDATGTFDGVLPMLFDDSGGRIEGGKLTVRPGGGTLAYVGDLTNKNLGVWGSLAFQALRSLRYRDLTIGMNGPLAGEMVTDVRFAGISQGEGATSNFLVRRLQRLPFVFNIRIKAPFRGLLDSAQSFYEPRRLIQRNLPALLEQQRRRQQAPAPTPPAKTPPVQPSASETVP